MTVNYDIESLEKFMKINFIAPVLSSTSLLSKSCKVRRQRLMPNELELSHLCHGIPSLVINRIGFGAGNTRVSFQPRPFALQAYVQCGVPSRALFLLVN